MVHTYIYGYLHTYIGTYIPGGVGGLLFMIGMHGTYIHIWILTHIHRHIHTRGCRRPLIYDEHACSMLSRYIHTYMDTYIHT